MRIFRAYTAPNASNIRELKAFLESPRVAEEKSLQKLLEQNPSLIGALGFSAFLSEVPLYKTNADNRLSGDLRCRDRADFIAATTSPLLQSYRAANIIELKGATRLIAGRRVGSRLSVEASHAVQQLHEYRHWLTTIPQNRDILDSLEWDVRWPSLSLIMGQDQQFAGNPGQLEEIRARLLDEGVRLFTLDDVLATAIRQMENRVVAPNVVDLYSASPASFDPSPDIYFAGAVVNQFSELFRNALENPSTLAAIPQRAFEEVVAELYRRRRYVIEMPLRVRGVGPDIFATANGPFDGQQFRLFVMCRRYETGELVGLETVKELVSHVKGAPMSGGFAPRGILITNAELSAQARLYLNAENGWGNFEVHTLDHLFREMRAVIDEVIRASEPPEERWVNKYGLWIKY